jgi:glycosyltransferase involved in cell wall biosynthesis
MSNPTFSILICTKNRIKDLTLTLNSINYLLENDNVNCVIFDDGSTDGTFNYIKVNFPQIQLQRNEISKGLIFCRNKMLNETSAQFAISLDDDAHFLTENPLDPIQKYFEKHQQCGLIALRIFWGLVAPENTISNENPNIVKGFVGCGHVWKMSAWRTIPNYPSWFVFYGEEDFAAFQLFKKKLEIHYLPAILVHHRVDVKSRKKNADYALRLQRSLRAGWYLMFLFYPLAKIPKLLIYSLWIQLKLKVFKGDWRALKAILLALLDLMISIPRIIVNCNRLSHKEYDEYQNIPNAKIYWQPNSMKNEEL